MSLLCLNQLPCHGLGMQPGNQGLRNADTYAAPLLEQYAKKLDMRWQCVMQGALCPCCDSTSCHATGWARNLALQARGMQADKLLETAHMLRQIFYSVSPYVLSLTVTLHSDMIVCSHVQAIIQVGKALCLVPASDFVCNCYWCKAWLLTCSARHSME